MEPDRPELGPPISTEDRVMEIIERHCGRPNSINLLSDLSDDLAMDSLDRIETCMALEESFDIEMPDEDMDETNTVQDVVDYINERIK